MMKCTDWHRNAGMRNVCSFSASQSRITISLPHHFSVQALPGAVSQEVPARNPLSPYSRRLKVFSCFSDVRIEPRGKNVARFCKMFAVMVRKHFNALLDDGRINHTFYDTTSRLFFLQWSPAASSRIFIPYPFFFFRAIIQN